MWYQRSRNYNNSLFSFEKCAWKSKIKKNHIHIRFSPGWSWLWRIFPPSKWLHKYIVSLKITKIHIFFFQLVLEIPNFPKQIFINVCHYFFKNWLSSRPLKTNYRTINFYHCCYLLNCWFFGEGVNLLLICLKSAKFVIFHK